MTKKHGPLKPPQWAETFLCWYCRTAILEDLQGDLHELFQRNVKTKGIRRAQLIYVVDVLKFLRLYTIRKPSAHHLLIHLIMLRTYIKTSSRSIARHKLFSAINIVGLAISMSVGLLMIAILVDLLSYDKLHEKRERIYRVVASNEFTGQAPQTLATSSVKAGMYIRQNLTGIENVTLLRRGFGGDATIGQNTLPLSGLWADNTFFSVFSFPLVKGNPHTALKEPYSLVLTETTATKMFGTTDALGKGVKFDTTEYVVTGIMKDVPKLSHMTFEALASFSTIERQKPDFDGGYLSWDNIYSNYTYVLLPEENRNVSDVQNTLDKFCAAENMALKDRKITLSLQPLNDIVFQPLGNPIGPNIHVASIWVLGGLALVVILSACFNYANLSVSRSLRRSREVGIRKVIGAFKSHVLAQFITESVIIALLALVFSFLLFLFLRTEFLSLSSWISGLLSLELSPKLIAAFVALAMVVGIIAGLLPALFFSRINAIQVLKDVSSIKGFRHVNLRKALVIVQYTFSLIFITSTIIGYHQYKGFLTFDLGFTTENILNIKLQGNKADVFTKELLEIPGVTGVSQSVMVSSLGSIYGTVVKYKKIQDSSNVWLNVVDEHYLSLHNYKFTAGKNFQPLPSTSEESEVIVNEQLLKRFGLNTQDPSKALGEVLHIGEKELTIVGVLKDFHYGTLLHKIEPLIFRYASAPNGYVNVRVSPHQWSATLAQIEKAWKQQDKVHPLEATFYDDQLEEAYNQFSVMVKIIGFLAFLAVCIASMGLFGMVVFTTETRLKEISIRKVLGANEATLIYLLSKGFLTLLICSAALGLPATYFLFQHVVLTKFAYHTPIGLTELFAGFVGVMTLALIMIGSQTFKIARANPAAVLKTE